MRTRNQHSGKRLSAFLPRVQSPVSPSRRSLANSFKENGEMFRFNENSLKLSILIPVFNEAQTLAAVVERVQAVPIEQEIVLVDDASSDGTAGIVDRLASHRVWVLHHPANQGKGAAVRTALAAVTGDLIVIQDADFEYDPNDFVRMMAPIAAGQAEVVYGVRSLESQCPIMRFGNGLVTSAVNLLYRQHLRDIETCYKMMWREIALRLELECRRFDIEAEVTAKLLRLGYAIHEVPIRYTARYDKKKLSPWDGLPTLRALWKYRHWRPSSRLIGLLLPDKSEIHNDEPLLKN
ncbi:MAG: Undecaprenyl-phosphate 4-deoxy-4-formamido-L-arabinose transferase [Syntrophorhabdaceae bacterium]|nr:Undecaprenyl-phosphate 4-deoxy-4-formamido-L-arabinose transferase [Syntrophorhabdaceae bacterium]